MQVRLNLGSLGQYFLHAEEIAQALLADGDAVWHPGQQYHGTVFQLNGRQAIKWWKWDPAIDMPVVEYTHPHQRYWKIVENLDELDLTAREKGGPYN